MLAASGAIEPRVKTLDALHLCSVIAAGLDAPIVTHDAGMNAAAAALGYATLDPVDDIRRGRGWHRGQYVELRFMNCSLRMRVPHRRHGRPSWP